MHLNSMEVFRRADLLETQLGALAEQLFLQVLGHKLNIGALAGPGSLRAGNSADKDHSWTNSN